MPSAEIAMTLILLEARVARFKFTKSCPKRLRPICGIIRLFESKIEAMYRQSSEIGNSWLQATLDLVATIPISVSEWWEQAGIGEWFGFEPSDPGRQERMAVQEQTMDAAIDEDITFQHSGFPKSALGKTPQERVRMLRWAISQDKILVADEIALLMRQKKDKLDTTTTIQVTNIQRDVAALRELLCMIKLDEGWTPAGREAKGVRVMYRKEADSPFIMTKTSTILQPAKGEDLVSLFIKYVCLFKETDLMPKWFPRKLINSNKTLKEITPFQLVTNLKLTTPIYLPIGKRECYLLGRGYDMAERRAICISFKSIEGDLGYYQVPSVEETGVPRFEIRGAYYVEMKPGRNGNDGHIVFHALQLLDLKMKFVPASVINLVSKGALPFDFITCIKRSIAQHKGSPWEARVQQRAEFYDNLRQRLYAVVAETQEGETSEESEPASDANDDETLIRQSTSRKGKFLLRKITSRFSTSRQKSGDGKRVSSSSDPKSLQPRQSLSQRIQSKVSGLRNSKSRPAPPPIPYSA